MLTECLWETSWDVAQKRTDEHQPEYYGVVRMTCKCVWLRAVSNGL